MERLESVSVGDPGSWCALSASSSHDEEPQLPRGVTKGVKKRFKESDHGYGSIITCND